MEKSTIALIALAVLAVLNAVSFLLMACDKRRAKKGQWRIPEKTLFLATGCFGGLGGVLGMRLLRHKTQHKSFVIGFPALLGVQVVILAIGAYMLFR